MNSKEKFKNFLESLKGKGQDVMVENIEEGFRACFESEETFTVKVKKDVRLKSGDVIPTGEEVKITFTNYGRILEVESSSLGRTVKIPTTSGYRYFSKFINPPSVGTMEKWVSDGIAKTVTGHRTEPDGFGPDGSPSWLLVIGVI